MHAQVDVRLLKTELWHSLCAAHQQRGVESANKSTIDFKSTLQQLGRDAQGAPLEDISVHLCFICLLHLANENGLCLEGEASLDVLHIGGLSGA